MYTLNIEKGYSIHKLGVSQLFQLVLEPSDGFSLGHFKLAQIPEAIAAHKAMMSDDNITVLQYQVRMSGEKLDWPDIPCQWVACFNHIETFNSRIDTIRAQMIIDGYRKGTVSEIRWNAFGLHGGKYSTF